MAVKKYFTIPFGKENFLSILEGVEGGFAIFTGILVGLSFETLDRRLLIITALIGILVNGFNSSAVRYSSEHYDDELDGSENRRGWHAYFGPAAVEFLAYTVVSILVLLPLLLIPSVIGGVICCVVLTLVVLFAAGYLRGSIFRVHPFRDGIELTLLGLGIIIIGAIAGLGLSTLLAKG